MAVPLETSGHHPQGDQPTIWRAPSQETAPTTRCNGRWATSSLVCVPAALRECRVPGLHAQTGTPRGRPSRGTAGTNPKTGGHQPKDWQALPFNTVGDHEFFLAFGICVSEIVRGSFILVWGYVGIGRRVPIVLSCYSLRFSLHSLFFLALCQLRSCSRQFCSIRTARSNFRSCFSQCVGTSGCQLCHFRLNGPVRGIEDNIQRDMNSPDARCFKACVFAFCGSGAHVFVARIAERAPCLKFRALGSLDVFVKPRALRTLCAYMWHPRRQSFGGDPLQIVLNACPKVRFTKSTLRQASIREKKGPSLGKTKAKSLRSKIRGSVPRRDWTTTAMCPKQGLGSCQNMYKLKENDRTTFFSLTKKWVLPSASSRESCGRVWS